MRKEERMDEKEEGGQRKGEGRKPNYDENISSKKYV